MISVFVRHSGAVCCLTVSRQPPPYSISSSQETIHEEIHSRIADGNQGRCSHGETCGIGQTAVSDAAADGIQLTVVDRKKVTTGGVESVECIVRCDLAPECFEVAAQTLKDLEAAEAAKLVTPATDSSSPGDHLPLRQQTLRTLGPKLSQMIDRATSTVPAV